MPVTASGVRRGSDNVRVGLSPCPLGRCSERTNHLRPTFCFCSEHRCVACRVPNECAKGKQHFA